MNVSKSSVGVKMGAPSPTTEARSSAAPVVFCTRMMPLWRYRPSAPVRFPNLRFGRTTESIAFQAIALNTTGSPGLTLANGSLGIRSGAR